MTKLTTSLAILGAGLLAGCTKPEAGSDATVPRYSVQVGAMGMAFHITDHQENKLYSYAQMPKEKDLALYLTIDLTSAGQETLTFTEIKK
jgi:hypothetical protein